MSQDADGRLGEHRDELVVRTRLLAGFVLLCFGLILASYWRVQILDGARYRLLADHNRFREQPIRAPRGLIYDRGDRLLVENVPSYNLFLDRSRARDVPAALSAAASILRRPRQELVALLDRYRTTPSFTPVLVAENLSLAEVARFGVTALEHPEFEIEVGHVRLYRQAEQLAHILGYLGEVSADDLASGHYRSGEWVGKKGLEQTYDAELRGADGSRIFVVDSRGRLLAEHGERPARAGAELHLTIDLALQQEAQRALSGLVGAVVALDPRDGAILAMVSAPSFDPNRFARRLQVADWRALLDSPFHPLQNRAFQNSYAPGSVFKPVVALAALSTGVIDPRETVYCGGAARIYNHVFRCWKRGGHGRVDLHAALRESCDVYFYHLAPRVGIEAIAAQARELGLGATTGIELSGEKSGLVPDPRWSLAVRRHPWYPGETVSVAIGQGPLLTTPLQMATAIAAIANGGALVRPHLEARAAAPPRRLRLDPRALALVRAGMVAVVNENGTGGAARMQNVEVAGKTGTVQVVSQRAGMEGVPVPWELRDHAWFVSYAPAADPTLVVVVFVEHGGKGSAAAAPIAKRLYEIHFADHPGPARPV